MRTRKPIVGPVSQRIEKVAAIQRQMAREHDRHKNKVAGIAAQRDVLHGSGTSALSAAKLAKLRYDEIEENQRHKSKLAELQRRVWEVLR